MAQATFSWPFGPIHLESACLRFRLTAKTATAPLLLLFPANPLRWASPGVRERLTKTPPGTAPDEHFVLIVAFPRTPLRGTRTCWILQHFRRAKSEWRSEISTGPLRRRGFRIPRFARIGQSSLTPSLLLSNANPLRWALRWGPPTAAFINEDWESETSFITRAF